MLAFTDGAPRQQFPDAVALEAIVASSARGVEGVAELRAMDELAKAGGYNENRISIDPSVVRGLEYYTGPVFEADLSLRRDRRQGPSDPLRLDRRRRTL